MTSDEMMQVAGAHAREKGIWDTDQLAAIYLRKYLEQLKELAAFEEMQIDQLEVSIGEIIQPNRKPTIFDSMKKTTVQ